ncbi:MAG: O-antigen ligase family protein [Novosphingobium sp.]
MKRGFLLTAILLTAAIVLGGGGSPNPQSELALELVAAAVAFFWLLQGPGFGESRTLLGIAAAIAVLPLLQLVPLPPAIWQALPGRADAAEALALVGAADTWRPWSLSPSRTLAALLSLGPPLLTMFAVASLGRADRGRAIAVVAGLGLVSAALGAAQLAGGRGALRLYAQNHDIWITGFHANRNAVVDVLLIAAMAIAVVYRDRRSDIAIPSAGVIAAAAGAILLLAAVLTGSRAGIALIPFALLAAASIAGWGRRPTRKTALIASALGAVTVAVCFAAFQTSTAIQSVVGRFGLTRDFRLELWSDTLFAAGRVWPFGSGMGTFTPMAIAVERLETIDGTLPNRAHNDYLELLLEGGAFGLAALATAALLVAALARRAWRNRPAERAQVVFAAASLGVIAAHSMVDYPMRTMALACLAGLAAGLLAPLPSGVREAAPSRPAENEV